MFLAMLLSIGCMSFAGAYSRTIPGDFCSVTGNPMGNVGAGVYSAGYVSCPLLEDAMMHAKVISNVFVDLNFSRSFTVKRGIRVPVSTNALAVVTAHICRDSEETFDFAPIGPPVCGPDVVQVFNLSPATSELPTVSAPVELSIPSANFPEPCAHDPLRINDGTVSLYETVFDHGCVYSLQFTITPVGVAAYNVLGIGMGGTSDFDYLLTQYPPQ